MLFYVVDALGQPGESVQSRPMFTPADSARCIDAVLEGLGLQGVHLVGHSYGGWLATHTAAVAPHRLASVTLVDPANTVARLSTRFLTSDHVLRSVGIPVQVLLAGNTVHDSERGIARMRSVVPAWRCHLWRRGIL